MSIKSMTGYASISGSAEGLDWVWEARSVNARGLDIRVRVPDQGEALEAALRKQAPAIFSRGNISITLRVNTTTSEAAFALNEPGIASVLAAALKLEQAAQDAGVTLAPLGLGDLLSHRTVTREERASDQITNAEAQIAGDIPKLLKALDAARAAEGAALAPVITAQIEEIARLTNAASETAEARNARAGEILKTKVAAVLEATERVDEARLAQELALLAVKADVTEELDRLRAHIEAARTLLATDAPTGRKLDFLMQEFNREANTLCSKSGAPDLTAIGLDLKVVIDQLREQAANVE